MSHYFDELCIPIMVSASGYGRPEAESALNEAATCEACERMACVTGRYSGKGYF